MLIGKEKSDENKYLSLTIETIESLLGQYVDSSKVSDKDIVKHRRFLWENRTELDEIEVNENCMQVAMKEKMHAQKVNRINTLERQMESPYFARIDFKEEGEDKAESFYIGISTVENQDDFEFLVFDWRSPVSTMFYDFEVGEAFYEAPNRIVKGNLEFSRQFNIRNGEIVFMHDSNESLCDESLKEMLGNNANDKMKNIVATIQKEQNEIIRNEQSKALFIQGAAGSGKTSIALHRAAYILYKHRKELKADNILIFSPNEVFADYISNVLPELGESNILQTTFEQFAKTFLPSNYEYENRCKHLDFIYSNDKELDKRITGMEYKNSLRFIESLDKFIKNIPNLITNIKPIIIDGKEVISRKNVEKTILVRFKDIPFLNRLDVVKQSLFSQLETKYLVDNDEFDYVEDKENFYAYCKEQVNIQVDEMIKTLNSVEIYKMFWNSVEKYEEEDLGDVKEITLDYLEDREVKFEDITPIIYIRASMEGFRNYKNVRHILIDEAQDYSPLFYEIIKKSFKDSAITIMGDLNQRIDNYSNVKNRTDITKMFEDITTATLTKSYRSTLNITEFTKEILQNAEPIEAVDRRGINPKVYLNKDNIENRIIELINEMKERNIISIAIICVNKEECCLLYNKLCEKIDEVNLVDSDKSELKNGINIIPSYLAKGLEFDGVIVADLQKYKKDRDEHLLYTSCTRALHELHMFTNTNENSILPCNKKLYDYILL